MKIRSFIFSLQDDYCTKQNNERVDCMEHLDPEPDPFLSRAEDPDPGFLHSNVKIYIGFKDLNNLIYINIQEST